MFASVIDDLFAESASQIALWFFLYAMIAGGIGSMIGRPKNRAAEGFALGFFFFFLGWILTALLAESGAKCQECLGIVPPGARKCKHCGSDLKPRHRTGNAEEFFVARGGRNEGPFTLKQLQVLHKAGKLDADVLIAREGDSEWQPLSRWM
jgi:hypothetical protein